MNVQVSIVADTNNLGQYVSTVVSWGTPFSTNATVYDALGRVSSRTGPDGRTTSYDYFADGQTKSMTDALAHTTYYEYDAAGHQSKVADALNQTNQFAYDALGRMIKTTLADATWASNVFNELGQRVGAIDQASLQINYGFDISGQLTNVVMPQVLDPESGNTPASPSWAYHFDLYGRLTTTTDAKGRATTNTYDALGRPLTLTLPLGQTETNLYNSKGQLWKKYDFKGQRTEFVYDKLRGLLRVQSVGSTLENNRTERR